MGFFLSLVLPVIFSVSHSFANAEWELINEDDGVKSYRKKIEDSRTVAFKGEGQISASPIRILSVLSDIDRYPEWNKNLKKISVIEKKSINDRIQYVESRVPFPYKNREVVVRIQSAWDEKLGAIVLQSQSVEDERAPKDTGCVRAILIGSRYILKPTQDWKSTELTIEIHADPMGNIPGWLVNLFQKSWARKTIETLRKRTVEPGVIDNEEIKSFMMAEAKRLNLILPKDTL